MRTKGALDLTGVRDIYERNGISHLFDSLDKISLAKNLNIFNDRKEIFQKNGIEPIIEKYKYEFFNERFYNVAKNDDFKALIHYIKINNEDRDFSDIIAADMYFQLRYLGSYQYEYFDL